MIPVSRVIGVDNVHLIPQMELHNRGKSAGPAGDRGKKKGTPLDIQTYPLEDLSSTWPLLLPSFPVPEIKNKTPDGSPDWAFYKSNMSDEDFNKLQNYYAVDIAERTRLGK